MWIFQFMSWVPIVPATVVPFFCFYCGCCQLSCRVGSYTVYYSVFVLVSQTSVCLVLFVVFLCHNVCLLVWALPAGRLCLFWLSSSSGVFLIVTTVVRENVCNLSKKRNHLVMQRLITQLPEVGTGKSQSPTSNMLFRSVDSRHKKLCNWELCVWYMPITCGSFEAKISIDIQQTWYFFVTFYVFLKHHFKKT